MTVHDRAFCLTQPASEPVLSAIRSVADAHAPWLADKFYEVLLADPDAERFLDHSIVETRLKQSLARWLRDLCAFDDITLDTQFAALQRRVGEVHARIKVPMALVMKGATVLKWHFADLLMAERQEAVDTVRAIIEVDRRVDWAIGEMSEAYTQGVIKRANVDEAFRLFAVGQDINHERESQIAVLLEWLQGVLFPLFEESPKTPLTTIASSPFGLWFHHRAGLVFQGLPSLEAVGAKMREIDDDILPRLEAARCVGGDQLVAELARLKAAVQEIRFLVVDLFQSVSGIEHGRDPLTRALSRRFLPTILGREIAIAEQSGVPLTLLIVDVDHFKKINDTWGHAAGDFVLRQVAEVITEAVRLNDFVFRYGGEEFLIALVETDIGAGAKVAERICAEVAGRSMRLPNGEVMQVTASVGVAAYEGHPDYNEMIQAADRALYAAKEGGRNRVAVAGA